MPSTARRGRDMLRSEAVEGRWPEIILSSRAFTGGGSLSRAAALDCMVRFSRPEAIAFALSAAAEGGAGAIMSTNDASVLQGLEICRAQSRLPVYPVIPDALGYVRDATDHGMVGAGIRHLRRMRVSDLLGLGMRGLASLRRVLLRDFRAILPLLLEVEMAAFRRFQPRLVFLHSQVTDLAIALGNHEALRIFAGAIRRRFGAEPGLATCNLGLLLLRLAEWEIDIRVIAAPFNSKGFLMKPSRAACESLLRETDRYIIADRLGAGGTPFDDELAYVQGLGIRSAVVETVARFRARDRGEVARCRAA